MFFNNLIRRIGNITNGAPASWRGAPKNTGRAELLTLGMQGFLFSVFTS